MKRTLTLFCVCWLGYGGYAQSLFSFGTLNKDTAIVYRGIDNWLQIKEYDSSSVYRVEATQGRVLDVDRSGYFVYSSAGFFSVCDTLSLFKNNQLCGRVEVVMASIPNPRVHLAGGMPGKIRKDLLLAAPYLSVTYPNIYINMHDAVTDFYVTVWFNSYSDSFWVKGNRLSPELIARISTFTGKIRLDFDARFWGRYSCLGRSMSFSYDLY